MCSVSEKSPTNLVIFLDQLPDWFHNAPRLDRSHGDARQQGREEEIVPWRDHGDIKLSRLEVVDDTESSPSCPEDDNFLLDSSECRSRELLHILPSIVGT